MLIKLLIIILQLSSPSDEFFQHLLEDYSKGFVPMYSNCVVIYIENNEEIYEAVIESNYLHHYITKTHSISGKDYFNYAKNILSNKAPFKVNQLKKNKKLDNYLIERAMRVDCKPDIEKESLKGKVEFLNKYINSNYINVENQNDLFCIISILYKWNIIVRKDSETGFYFIQNYEYFNNMLK